MSSTTRGRFGVTRDEDGSLSSIYAWPWYWRYPAALAGIVACLWFAAIKGVTPRPDWLMLALAAGGALASLSLAYEAFILALFLTIILVPAWGVSKIAEQFFPSLAGWHLPWQAGALVFGGIYVYTELSKLRMQMEALVRTNARLERRLMQLHGMQYNAMRRQGWDHDDLVEAFPVIDEGA